MGGPKILGVEGARRGGPKIVGNFSKSLHPPHIVNDRSLRKTLLVQTQQKGTFCPKKPIRLYAHISGPFPRNILLVQTQPLRNILPLETHSCFMNIPVCPNIKVYK